MAFSVPLLSLAPATEGRGEVEMENEKNIQ